MEFWGVEVKAGELFKVQPEFGKLIHISQAALGEVKDVKGAKHVPIRMTIDANKYVIGTLSAVDRPQVMFDLVFEREFELSHDWKSGSVYFAGYIADDQIQDEQDFSDESDDEEYPIEALKNGGIPQLKVEDVKPTKDKATAAKTGIKKEEAPETDERYKAPAAKTGIKKEKAPESESDDLVDSGSERDKSTAAKTGIKKEEAPETDERYKAPAAKTGIKKEEAPESDGDDLVDSGSERDKSTAAKTGIKKEEAPESDDDLVDSGSDDLSGEMDSEDLEDASDESSEEETLKVPQQLPQPKKRKSSVLETPDSNKKAKLVTNCKTGNRRTPYPSKKTRRTNKTK